MLAISDPAFSCGDGADTVDLGCDDELKFAESEQADTIIPCLAWLISRQNVGKKTNKV
jgi:hypothetical protein